MKKYKHYILSKIIYGKYHSLQELRELLSLIKINGLDLNINSNIPEYSYQIIENSIVKFKLRDLDLQWLIDNFSLTNNHKLIIPVLKNPNLTYNQIIFLKYQFLEKKFTYTNAQFHYLWNSINNLSYKEQKELSSLISHSEIIRGIQIYNLKYKKFWFNYCLPYFYRNKEINTPDIIAHLNLNIIIGHLNLPYKINQIIHNLLSYDINHPSILQPHFNTYPCNRTIFDDLLLCIENRWISNKSLILIKKTISKNKNISKVTIINSKIENKLLFKNNSNKPTFFLKFASNSIKQIDKTNINSSINLFILPNWEMMKNEDFQLFINQIIKKNNKELTYQMFYHLSSNPFLTKNKIGILEKVFKLHCSIFTKEEHSVIISFIHNHYFFSSSLAILNMID